LLMAGAPVLNGCSIDVPRPPGPALVAERSPAFLNKIGATAPSEQCIVGARGCAMSPIKSAKSLLVAQF
jgi:hypothetical protein